MIYYEYYRFRYRSKNFFDTRYPSCFYPITNRKAIVCNGLSIIAAGLAGAYIADFVSLDTYAYNPITLSIIALSSKALSTIYLKDHDDIYIYIYILSSRKY
jgi:hypothetical protein